MRQILSRSLLTVAAASSVLAATGGYASADSGAQGAASGSPGLLSGNTVQAPIDVPVNACGNTVDVAALANPVFGNHCGTTSRSARSANQADQSVAKGSPGAVSGNAVDIPVHAPVNACGDTVDAVAALNPASGNSCGVSTVAGQASTVDTPPQAPSRHAHRPEVPSTPPPRVLHPDAPATASGPAPQMDRRTDRPMDRQTDQQANRQADRPTDLRMAETGVGGRELGAVGATSAALLLGGAMLYRRGVRPAHARRAH
jgi:hypothetical protein